jgi:uncharacterized protein (TIGR01777 family)
MTLHVAISGASGLIGTMLRKSLAEAGHRVTALVRRPPGPGEIRWDPAGSGLDPASLRGVDAVVHLAGENLAEGRWTDDRKRKILESRKLGTRLLAEAMARAPGGPRTLVSASAIGYYGERGDEELTEASPPGTGFLPEVCVAWEAATAPAAAAGLRVVQVRTGLLLTPAGGLLPRILPPFRLFVGGRLGDGQQWMSWISAADLLGVYRQALEGDLIGPVNAVAPGAVRNEQFTRVLAKVLHRPAVMVVPRTALRLAYGQMADEAILASTRVLPAALQTSGFQFEYPTLEPALGHLLHRENS